MPTSPRPLKHQGFALVVALLLMSFILLLILSLNTVANLEVRNATSKKLQTASRQNALLALNIAIGELQRYAGNDQRTTAPADILSTTGYSGVVADDKAKHWTGVWDSTQNRGQSFMKWLVSSDGTIDMSDESAVEVMPTNMVTLVGTGTYQDPTSPLSVDVPKVSLEDNQGSISGSYAYWVGDEGVKAKFQGAFPSAQETTNQRAQFDFRLNQRNAIETYGDLAQFPVGSSFSQAMSNQPRSTSLGELLLPDTANTEVPDTNLLKQSYFDYTPFSFGLLTSNRSGGWKKDLTWLFEAEDVQTALDLIDAKPGVSGSQISANWPENPAYAHWAPSPTWELLRSFYRYSSQNEPLPVTQQTGLQHGLTPVMTHCVFHFIPGLNGMVSDNDTPSDTSDDYFAGKLRVYMDFRIVLWNPYDVALNLPASDIEILFPSSADELGPDMKFLFGSYGNDPVSHNGFIHETFKGPGGEGFTPFHDTYSGDMNGYALSFRMPATTMQPGAIMIFMLSDSEDGNGYTGENILANTSSFGRGSLVWLENDTLIDNTTSPLNGSDVIHQPFTFEKKVSTGGGVFCWQIGLRAEGTAGNDSSIHNDYYARYALRRSMGGGFYNQFVNADNPNLAEAIFDTNGNHIVDATETNVYASEPTYSNAPTLLFDISMHTSNVGFRNSRWAYNYNPRASVMNKTEVDESNNPLYFGEWQSGASINLNNTQLINGDTLIADRPTLGDAYSRYQAILYSVPEADYKPISIGDFQHANVHPHEGSNAYLIGNSLVDMRLANTNQTYRLPNDPDNYSPIIDGSYLLNEALWDDYFMSTIDGRLTQVDIDQGRSFPNSRIQMTDTSSYEAFLVDPDRFTKGASQLEVNGMFNINSTSVEAWKSVLGSAFGLGYDPVSAAVENTELPIAFSRLYRPGGDANEDWRGYRELDGSELQALASSIVDVIRERGPFLDLADFINRRLGEPAGGAGLRGVLDEAIERSSINTNAKLNLADGPGFTNTSTNMDATAKSWYIEEALLGSRNAGETRWLSQGDLLQLIGGMLSARSDTFVIRTYGEAINPLTGNMSKSYLEATVQRTPTPVVPTASDPMTPANSFGRKFEIVNFRWLHEDEI